MREVNRLQSKRIEIVGIAYSGSKFNIGIGMNNPTSNDRRCGDESLRRGRWSESGATYFLTLCTRDRREGLTRPEIATALRSELSSCEYDRHCRVSAGVIMPDHLHLLVELTGALGLSRVVARVKAKTRTVLNAVMIEWQSNFYEHRMRPDDPKAAVLRYIMLNPFRAGLIDEDEKYAWAWMHADEAQRFDSSAFDEGKLFPAWLQ